MKIFLDTSSLFKLSHRESGTELLEVVFTKRIITAVFLSQISEVEFTSTVWKKVRTKEITSSEAQSTLDLFEADFTKYTFVAIDSFILEQARSLITKYGEQGLRRWTAFNFLPRLHSPNRLMYALLPTNFCIYFFLRKAYQQNSPDSEVYFQLNKTARLNQEAGCPTK